MSLGGGGVLMGEVPLYKTSDIHRGFNAVLEKSKPDAGCEVRTAVRRGRVASKKDFHFIPCSRLEKFTLISILSVANFSVWRSTRHALHQRIPLACAAHRDKGRVERVNAKVEPPLT